MDLSKERPTERFSGLAETYAKHRPTYPKEAIDFVLSHCGLKEGSTVVDVGCGTGISTRLLAERKLHVIGIEPNDDMRQQAEKASQDGADFAAIEYRTANAEKTGLPDESTDAVVAAQAFHWFEPQSTLTEFLRILRPGGWVVLIWNERDDNDSYTKAYSSVIRTTLEARRTEDARQAAGQVLLDSHLFVNGSRQDIRNEQLMTEEESIGRAFSCSYAPKDEAMKKAWRDGLHAIFEQYSNDRKVTLCYRTSVYTAQKP